MICRPEHGLRTLLAVISMLAVAACSNEPVDLQPIDKARTALEAGDGLGAEITLRDMLASGTPQEEIAAYLGEAELLQAQLVEARRWLGEGNFSDATAGHGHHMLGRLEMRSGNLPAAGQAFDRAHAVMPENSDLWVDIGRLRFRGGEQKQAIEASKRAVELDPTNPDALLLRAQLVRDSEGLSAALGWLEAGLEQSPDNLELLGEYAATLGDLGRAGDMLVTIRRMAEIDDRNPRLYYLQAVLAARGGDFMLARSLLDRAGPGIGESPAGMLLSGVVDIQNGNYQSAAQVLDRLATIQPDNQRVRELLVRAVAMGLNDRELVHRFGGMASLPSASPYIRELVGRNNEAIDRRADGEPLLGRAVQARPTSLIAIRGRMPLAIAQMRREEGGSAIQSLVRGRIQAGQTGSAISEMDTFRRRFPGSADALGLAGDARLADRRPADALTLYREAAAIRLTWPLVRRMVVAQRATGQGRVAERQLAQYLAGHPANAEAAAALAVITIEQQDWPRAAILLDHALDRAAARDPVLWRQRAFVAQKSGDIDLAFDAAVYAYGLQPMSARSSELLASVLEQQSQTRTAAALRQKLSRMGG